MLVLDTESKAWSKGPNLKHARCGHSALSLAEYLYVFGGFNDPRMIGSIERINPLHEVAWSVIVSNDVKVRRKYSVAVAVRSDSIAIFGGPKRDGKMSDGYILNVKALSLRPILGDKNDLSF